MRFREYAARQVPKKQTLRGRAPAPAEPDPLRSVSESGLADFMGASFRMCIAAAIPARIEGILTVAGASPLRDCEPGTLRRNDRDRRVPDTIAAGAGACADSTGVS